MPKVLIIVLVAVGVLFFVIVAGGATRDDDNDSGDTESSLVDNLEDALLGSLPRIQPEEVAASCRQGNNLVFDQFSGCVSAIPESGTPVRELKLVAREGTSSITLAQEDNVDLENELSPSDGVLGLRIFKKGGTLSLACDTSCVLEIQS